MSIETELPSKIKSILERREGIPRRVFVDLGSGVFPVAFVGNQEFKDSDYYVGVESDGVKIKTGLSLGGDLMKNPENRSRIGENVFFIERPVRELPFPDGAVDEVFLGNILGERAIHSVDDFLKQAQRVLRSGGTLIILEIQTPSVARTRAAGGIESFVESFGFKKFKEVKSDDPDFQKEASKYSLHRLQGLEGDEFVVYFIKE